MSAFSFGQSASCCSGDTCPLITSITDTRWRSAKVICGTQYLSDKTFSPVVRPSLSCNDKIHYTYSVPYEVPAAALVFRKKLLKILKDFLGFLQEVSHLLLLKGSIMDALRLYVTLRILTLWENGENNYGCTQWTSQFGPTFGTGRIWSYFLSSFVYRGVIRDWLWWSHYRIWS